jgi:hypothetical protein
VVKLATARALNDNYLVRDLAAACHSMPCDQLQQRTAQFTPG